MTEPKMKSNVKVIGRAPEKYSQKRIERDYQKRVNNLNKVVRLFNQNAKPS